MFVFKSNAIFSPELKTVVKLSTFNVGGKLTTLTLFLSESVLKIQVSAEVYQLLLKIPPPPPSEAVLLIKLQFVTLPCSRK